MSVFVYHGDDEEDSLRAFWAKVDELKQTDTQIIALDGKKLDAATLQDALEQEDFFGGPRAVTIKNLFSRPKSKVRDSLCALIAQAEIPVILWESKKLTPAALKPLGKAQIYESKPAGSIWALVGALGPDNNHKSFIQLYEKTLSEAGNSNDPGIYILATLLWQVQQLIDVKQNNFHGAPFARGRLASQASKFSEKQLLALHQRLIRLDYQAKSGGLQLPASKALLLELLA